MDKDAVSENTPFIQGQSYNPKLLAVIAPDWFKGTNVFLIEQQHYTDYELSRSGK